MIIIKGKKQPFDRKDWDADGTRWLVSGDPFVSATATVECLTTPTDTALVVETPNALEISSSYIKVWTTAGTAGEFYKITGQAITSANRRIEFEIIIEVTDD